MRHLTAITVLAFVGGWLCADACPAQQENESNLQPIPQLLPQLGEPSDAPAEIDPQRGTNQPEDAPQTAGDETPASAREAAIIEITRAEQYLSEGEYELAVRNASRAIATDPEHGAEYRQVRAAAYAGQGRYEEALADETPLEVTVTAERAYLKSGQDTVAEFPRGTRLLVESAEGNWLKVASAGEQAFDWAWVHRRDLRALPPVVGQAPPPSIVDRRQEPLPLQPDPRFFRPDASRSDVYARPQEYRGEEIVPPVYEVRPPQGYYYEGPGGDYGRRWYDWTRHVPRRYWRHLPW